jgi:hypothetical protein
MSVAIWSPRYRIALGFNHLTVPSANHNGSRAEHRFWKTHFTPASAFPDQMSGEKDAGSRRPS